MTISGYIAVFLIHTSSVVYGQKINCEYYIEVLPDSTSQIVYGWGFSTTRDTVVDCKDVQIFVIIQPSENEEGIKMLAQLKNLKELRLAGNDSDDFERLDSKYFQSFIKSKHLININICLISHTNKFEQYIKDIHSLITITKCYGQQWYDKME